MILSAALAMPDMAKVHARSVALAVVDIVALSSSRVCFGSM
jgi:hypothetical protein